jgi:hypothetical protein
MAGNMLGILLNAFLMSPGVVNHSHTSTNNGGPLLLILLVLALEVLRISVLGLIGVVTRW